MMEQDKYNYSPTEFRCIIYLSTKIDGPRSLREAMNMEQKELQIFTMDEDMVSLRKNYIWDLVPFLDIQKLIGCKWTLENTTWCYFKQLVLLLELTFLSFLCLGKL